MNGSPPKNARTPTATPSVTNALNRDAPVVDQVKSPRRKKQRIDLLLVERELVESRTKAAARIMAGDVIVDDQRVDKAGTKVFVDSDIRLKGDDKQWVSRGGVKLSHALSKWPTPLAGVTAVDVGASTGGFTHVLLNAGAVRVYAIDVGYGQLHWSLRTDARVVNMERTHIGKLDVGALAPAPTVAVIDVSFISLKLVLPALVPHLANGARIYALIKPQFEVGRAHVGKGGIVRDEDARKRAVDDVIACARTLGLALLGIEESPITGTDGNVEFVACFVAHVDVASSASADEITPTE